MFLFDLHIQELIEKFDNFDINWMKFILQFK